MVQLAEAKSLDDDWSGLASRAERKKRQNRLNQRARRRRKATDAAQKFSGYGLREHGGHLPLKTRNPAPVPQYPFSAGLRGPPSSSNGQDSTNNTLLPVNIATSVQTKQTKNDLNQPGFYFPLTSDHLMTLVQYNVYRACISNILLLNLGDLVNEKCKFISSSSPPNPIPANLQPTHLQQSIPHPSWIDVFPDPKLRDNMILAQGFYDELTFFNDLVGEVCGRIGTCSASQSASSLDFDEHKEERRGLIVWSDPWDINGWEVTPGFLKKWGWMLRGCDEFLAASNRWRAQRNEEPLLVEMSRCISSLPI